MAKCSAIIVSYRTGPALGQGLASIQQARAIDEIILVDNGNPSAEAAMLDEAARADPRVSLLRGQGNVGFAAGCNLGARTALGEILCFINPDVVLAPDAIERLLEVVAEAGGPAIIGGDLRDLDNRPDRGSRRDRLTLWRALVYATGLARFERLAPIFRDFNRAKDPIPPGPVQTSAVSGALMVMRRQDFQTLGGFDEGYFLHFEDIDLCRRAEHKGWRVLFAPGPHGLHLRSTSEIAPSVMAAHKAQSMARYFRKFARGPVEQTLSRAAMAALVFMHPPGRPQ